MYLSKMDKWLERNQKIIWILFIAVEYLLFKSFAEREVVDFMPMAYDQTVYLGHTYTIFDYISRWQLLNALVYAKTVITSSAMLLVTFVMLIFGGYSRLALLTWNFIFWVIMQFCGYKVIAKIGKSPLAGWTFVGLTLLLNTPFCMYGGMYDFRWEFMAFCMYTIWFLTLIQWLYYQKKQYMYISALVSGVVVFVRLYYAIFIAGFAVIYFAIRMLEKKDKAIDAIKGILIYGGLCVLGGGWSIPVFAPNIISYQREAANSNDSVYWNIAGGIKEYFSAYIGNLYGEHLNKILVIIVILLLAIIIGHGFFNKKKVFRNKWESISLLFVALAPSVVFILKGSQNQSVISVNMGACLAGIMYMLIQNTGEERKLVWERAESVAFIFIILMGSWTYLENNSHEYGYQRSIDVEAQRINETIVDYIADNNIEGVKILTDVSSDLVYSGGISVLAYEKYKGYVHIGTPASTITSLSTDHYSEEEIVSEMDACNFFVISTETTADQSLYATNVAIGEYRDQIIQYAKQNMVELLSTRYKGGKVKVYAKKSAPEVSGYTDGWLGMENNNLSFSKDNEFQKKIVMSGDCGYSVYDNLKLFVKEMGKEFDVEIDKTTGTYKCEIDISDLELDDYDMNFSFSDCFIPREVSESPDDRKLVIMQPESIRIVSANIYPEMTGYEDGWLGKVDNSLSFTKIKETQSKIVLEGDCTYTGYNDLQMIIEDLGKVANVDIDESDWKYSITIDISDLPIGDYEWSVSFNQAFIPSMLDASSQDERELVLRIPTKTTIN